VQVSPVSRKGYQTQPFDVDNLFSGLIDKQTKQSHFDNGGALNKAPKSTRRPKNKNISSISASQPAPESERIHDGSDYYSQGSAISDDKEQSKDEQTPNEISRPDPIIIDIQKTNDAQYETCIDNSAIIEGLSSPLFQHVQELLTSGQITDLNSYLSELFTSIMDNSNTNISNSSTNVNLGPLERILNWVH